MEYKKEEIFEKYKNVIHKLSILEMQKNYSEKYDLEDLKNEAWIGVIKAYETYDENKNTKIETHVFNYIKFHLMSFTRKNIYSVYVAHNELINLKNGFNTTNFKQIEKKYKKQLDNNIINLDKYNKIIEDYKKETKKNPIFELKEYKNNKDNENEKDIFGKAKEKDETELLIKNSLDKIKDILIKDEIITKVEFDFILELFTNNDNNKIEKKYEIILTKIKNYIKYKNIDYYNYL